MIPGRGPRIPLDGRHPAHLGGLGGLREEAAQATRARAVQGQASLEAPDRGIHQGSGGLHAGIVQRVARGMIVACADHHVIAPDDPQRIRRGQAPGMGHEVNLGVQPEQSPDRTLDFGTSEVLLAVQDLPVQVGQLDPVPVHQAQGADSGRGQVGAGRTAQATEAHHQDPRGGQAFLTLGPDLG